jgi:pimeloyl-ACP methyl ester carboxylesterase
MRLTGSSSRAAVVCVNGGQSEPVAGTWSASLEWLVRRLAPRFPSLAFSEVRYRSKSWRMLEDCVEDARAAVEATGAPRTLLLGFSMGGAVAVRTADAAGVEGVLGLAPWLPDRLDLDRLRGRRLDILHGMLDRWLPGIPGVSPASSRRGFERARRLGVEGTYRLIPGALHGVALRAPSGLLPLPRASRWAALAGERIAVWEAA